MMSRLISGRANTLLLTVFSVLWLLLIPLDYIVHHPYLTQSIAHFGYWHLITVLGSSFLFAYWFLVGRKESSSQQTRGIYVYLTLWAITTIILLFYCYEEGFLLEDGLTRVLTLIGRHVALHAGGLSIVALSYILGEPLTRKLVVSFRPASQTLLSIAIGFTALWVFLMGLGLFGLIYSDLINMLIIGYSIIRYRAGFHFLNRVLIAPIRLDDTRLGTLFLFFLILIWVSVTMIGFLKPFPVGFDGLSLYLNTSMLIPSEHQLLPSGAAYNWSLVMSLGELVLGSLPVTIFLSYVPGLLALFVLYQISTLLHSSRSSLLSVLLFLSIPMMIFHFNYDEKIDLALLFFSLTTLLLVLESWSKRQSESDKGMWLIAGWLAGFCFGIKYSVVFNIVGLLSLLSYRVGGGRAALGSLLISLGALYLAGVDQLINPGIGQAPPALWIAAIVLGLALIIPTLLDRQLAKSFSTRIVFFVIGGVIAILPWIINYGSSSPDLHTLLYGKSPLSEIVFSYEQMISGEVDLTRLSELRVAEGTARREEIRRYTGYEGGLIQPLSIPYDVTMNTNIPDLFYLDMGYFALLIIPFFFLRGGGRDLRGNLVVIAVVLGIYTMSAFSAFHAAGSGDFFAGVGARVADHDGVARWLIESLYTPLMGLVFFFISLIQPIYNMMGEAGAFSVYVTLLVLGGFACLRIWPRFEGRVTVVRSLAIYGISYFVIWFFLGSGIPWYGLTLIALTFCLVPYLTDQQNHFIPSSAKFLRYMISATVFLALSLALVYRFSDVSRRESTAGGPMFRKLFIAYQMGIEDYDSTLNHLLPRYPEALTHLNRTTEEKIYRAGTFLNFFIRRNHLRVYEDNQLDKFADLSSLTQSDESFLKVMYENGYRFILYDLATGSIDLTPEQTLKEKSNRFRKLLEDSKYLKLLETNNIVADPSGGEVSLRSRKYQGKFGLAGETVRRGNFALYEILNPLLVLS